MRNSKKYFLLAGLCISLSLGAVEAANQWGPPYISDPLNNASQSAQIWHINGSVASEDDNGLWVTDTGGASLISSVAAPDGSSQYQVSFQMNSDIGTTYVLYLEATPDALLNITGTSTGAFYAFAIQPYAAQDGGCAAQITLYKTIQGSVTQIAGTSTT